MLTFEEFFQKKKINLPQFQAAEPGLFAEFSAHYPLMGEKSFDHTKKYWFNGLRRNYPLAEAVKPHAVKQEAISPLAVQGVAVAAAQNIDAGIERPKFAEDNLLELVDENVLQSEVSLAEEEKIIREADPELSVTKPAFKPRFNATNIKKLEVENNLVESEEEKIEEREPAKPAFKPRFNMQNIKKDVVKEASEVLKSEVEVQAEPATENIQTETQSAKPAFKPRFNMQNIKKDVVKEALEPEVEVPKIQVKPATENPQLTIESDENKEAKPVYKPRFQMKNMPKPPSDQA